MYKGGKIKKNVEQKKLLKSFVEETHHIIDC